MKLKALPAARPVSAPPELDGSQIPLSLYVHFPWCVRKCPYCDFNSHALRGDVPEDAYIDALLRDLDFDLPQSRSVISLFMGGGTPSLFSARSLGRFLDGAAQRLRFAADIEITLEANPGTVDEAHFGEYRSAGINRLSIGVQSMDAVQLKRLGRIHDPQAVCSAVDVARRAGFDNLNLDLMFALPGQTAPEAKADLDAALSLAPEHLSYYQLTLEPNTEFAARPPVLPDEDLAWEMQSQAVDRLSQAGYSRYEVSAYARPGRRARHNLNYWTFGDYLGIGAGAHAKLSGRSGARRQARHKHPKTYMETSGSPAMIQEDRIIAAEELVFEFCMNALRLDQGFHWSEFESRTGLPRVAASGALAGPISRGLLRETATGMVPTALGLQHLNAILTALL